MDESFVVCQEDDSNDHEIVENDLYNENDKS